MEPMRGWQRRFFTFWTAQAFSLFGSQLAQFALVWWLTERTGSATVLATATLVAMLPGIVLGPLAGVFVDRWNRQWVIVVADAVGAIVAAVLALLFALGMIEVWHIFVAMGVRSLAGAFHFPAVQSSTSLMVPEDQLQRVAGLNQLLQGIMQIASPPLGALLITFLPFEGIMGIDVVTALIAVGLVFTIAIPQPARTATAAAATPSFWHELLAGLRYLWQWPGLRWVLLISALLNFVLTPAFSLLPILVTQHFGGDALQLAWLNTGLGVGVVAGSALLSVWGGFKRRIHTSLVGLAGLSLGALLIGVAPAHLFWVALAGIVIFGLTNPLANGPFFAILQTVVAPELQGRIFTVIGSFAAGMAPLGLLIAGPVADRLGVQLWYIVGGVACLLMAGLMAVTPAILQLEDRRADPLETTASAID
jgi:DHA3 family macrolide efflux protein-like MFS transporter